MNLLMRRVLAGFALVMADPAMAQVASTMPTVKDGETLVLVEARGITKVRPDYMVIEAGVFTSGKSARDAVDENNRAMQRVIEMLRADGINPSEVRTIDFDVDPKVDKDEPSTILAYEVNNRLRIELREFDRAGDTVSALFDAGANSVSGPSFRIDEKTELEAADVAERDAISFARKQAERIADQLGMRVSRVLRVSNRDIEFSRNYGGDNGGFIVVTGSRIAPTPIEPGVIDFSVDLYVEFALVPK